MSNVAHPKHYNTGRIEVIEFLEDQELGYHRGNVVKYVCRAGKKDPTKEIEDLEKAAWYLNREIERLKAEKEIREVVRPNDMNDRVLKVKYMVQTENEQDCVLQVVTHDDQKFEFHKYQFREHRVRYMLDQWRNVTLDVTEMQDITDNYDEHA